MTWTTLTFPFNSLLTSSKMTQLSDNITAVANGDSGAPEIQEAAYAAGSVNQAALKTSSGEVSTTTAAATIALPGGEYGFYPQVKSSSGSSVNENAYIAGIIVYTSYTTTIELQADTGAGTTVYAQQRYINSSPPYNLGEGDIPFFVFLVLDKDGTPCMTYCADVPPWAYNGPTRVTAVAVNDLGQKMRRRVSVDPVTGRVDTPLEVITHDIKNADMPLIPHPFLGGDLAGKSVVMLDPMSTEKLLDLSNAGESIVDIVEGGHLIIADQEMHRMTPPGVKAIPLRWRLTK